MARLFSIKPLVLALSIGFGACAHVYADDVSTPESAGMCHAPQQGFPSIAPPKVSGEDALPTDYTRITADSVAGKTQENVRADGEVIVERNDQVLNANWVAYDQTTDTIKAGDSFTLLQAGSKISGSHIEYNLQTETGTAEKARFEMEGNERRLQGQGDKVELKGSQKIEVQKVKFNTCSPGDDSWHIRASSVEANYEKGIGVARNATLVFGNVPVLYTPWADFPLNGNRKSGLLVPLIKIGSDGAEINAPYYFNLAPNYDATLSPGIITGRGAQLGGQFRYLNPLYRGEVNGTWMPDDRRSEHNNRYHANWRHQHQFSAKLSGGVDFNQVSDDDYFRDFYNRNDIAANVNLNRQAWLNYKTRVFDGPLETYATVQKYQTLANANGYKDEPYQLIPRLSASWQKNTLIGAQMSLLGQFTRFEHDSKQAGNRIVLYPSLRWNVQNDWGYIRPKVGVHMTHYNLDSYLSQSGRTSSRILPILNVDTGMTFERQTSVWGNDYVQTLEPRLFYNYIPTKSQNDLPNFDASENSFSYSQLFRENLYSGNDRINSANSISTAVQTRYLNRETGAERFRAGIGQKFYIKNDNVLLDGSVSRFNRNRSDWIAFANGNITDNISLNSDWHYNQNLNRTEGFSTGVRYNPEAGKVLSARYKYSRNEPIFLQENGEYYRDKLQQVDFAVQWPLRKNYYAVGRFNYDIGVKRPLEQLIGVEYKSDCGCWSASVVAQRYVTGLNTRKNAVFFNLQLKDLSNIGNNPLEQLRQAIPGYSQINKVTQPWI